MADWGGTTAVDDDEEVGGSAVQALANPRGYFADDEADAPQAIPGIKEGSPTEKEETNPDDAEYEQVAAGTTSDTGHGDQGADRGVLYDDPEGGIPPEMFSGTAPADSAGTAGTASASTWQAPKLPQMPTYKDPSGPEHELEQSIAGFNPQNYKPSLGRQVRGRIAAGLVGFGSRDAAKGIEAGRGVLDRPLNQARAIEQQHEAALRQQISDINTENQRSQQQFTNDEARYNLEERDLRNRGYVEGQEQRAQAARDQAQARLDRPSTFEPANPNNPWAGGTITTVGGKKIPNSAPPDDWLKAWSKTPQGQGALQAMTIQQRTQAADQMKLTGNDRKFFIADGKLQQPTQSTSIQIRENPDGSPVTPKTGGPRNPDENVSAIVADATQRKQEFANNWQRADGSLAGVPAGSYVNPNTGATMSAQEFNAKIDGFRTGANKQLAKYGAVIDEQGNVQRNAAPAAAPAAKPAAPAAQPQVFRTKTGQSYTVGQSVNAGGRPGKITGYNPKTDKPIVSFTQGQ